MDKYPKTSGACSKSEGVNSEVSGFNDKYRYFYHPESDCLIKVLFKSDEYNTYSEDSMVEEITRDDFLRLARELNSR